MAQQFQEYKERLHKHLTDKDKPWTPIFDLIEAKTGLERTYSFLGFVIILALYLAFGWAAQFFCNIIAVAYPAYISIKAIESPDKRDDTKWLTYWVVFAVFTNFEYFSSIITQVIPFYWLLKCVFYIWCFAPIENNGSLFIYHKIIRPYFLKYEKSTDDVLDKAMGKAKHLIDDAMKKD